MRRVALAIVSTVTGLIILLSFKTHPSATTASSAIIGTANPGGGTTTGSGSSSSTASTGSSTSSGTHAANSSATKTVTGDAVDTRYGPVQIQIRVKNGKITAVGAVQYPNNDPRDAQINAYAIPQLNQEVLSAQSAQINMISGATYTSEGYLSSLQSALDKAGL
jgi:uncharacterized protein with FMN-binding domain